METKEKLSVTQTPTVLGIKNSGNQKPSSAESLKWDSLLALPFSLKRDGNPLYGMARGGAGEDRYI